MCFGFLPSVWAEGTPVGSADEPYAEIPENAAVVTPGALRSTPVVSCLVVPVAALVMLLDTACGGDGDLEAATGISEPSTSSAGSSSTALPAESAPVPSNQVEPVEVDFEVTWTGEVEADLVFEGKFSDDHVVSTSSTRTRPARTCIGMAHSQIRTAPRSCRSATQTQRHRTACAYERQEDLCVS